MSINKIHGNIKMGKEYISNIIAHEISPSATIIVLIAMTPQNATAVFIDKGIQ